MSKPFQDACSTPSAFYPTMISMANTGVMSQCTGRSSWKAWWRKDVPYTELIYPPFIPLPPLGTSLCSGMLLKTNSSILFGAPVSLLLLAHSCQPVRHTQQQTGTLNLIWEFQDNMTPLNTADIWVCSSGKNHKEWKFSLCLSNFGILSLWTCTWTKLWRQHENHHLKIIL